MLKTKTEYKRVLLVPIRFKQFRNRLIPLGIAYIAAVLKKNNFKVKIFDPPPYKKLGIIEEINKFKPDIIGFSCVTSSYSDTCEIAKKVRENFKIPIVFGGPHPTAVPKEVLKNKFVDYIVIGEGEETFLEFLNFLSKKSKRADLRKIKGLGYKKNGRILINKNRELIENLDEIPFPARHLFSKWYFQRFMGIRGMWLKVANIMSTRGCPYNCTFCASKVLFGQRVRFRSVKNVVDEIEDLVKNYGINAVSFFDDTFSVNKKRAIQICREIRKRNIKIKLRVQLRSNTVTEDLVKELVKSGCVHVDIGVESGSQRILDIIKKGITVEQTLNAFDLLKKYGLRTSATLMVGNPTETMKDIELTKKLVRKLGADYAQFYITTPYPGTEMYKDELKKNPKLKKMSYDFFHQGGVDLMSLVSTNIPKEKLPEIQQELNEEFLKSAVFDLFRYPLFWVDMFSLLIQRPDVIARSMAAFIKTRRFTEAYRVFYSYQNYRRF